MKKLFLLLVSAILFASFSFAQNVGIGIITPASKLHIKGSADVSQLIIDANSTQSNTHPLIKFRKSDGTDLMWIHSDDVTNTFVGLNSGRVNYISSGLFSEGQYNTFIGSNAGYSNTTGYYNTANGSQALYSNTSGYYNTANGLNALYFDNIGSYNTANGTYALYSNTAGFYNTANGHEALYYNNTGNYNTANGVFALYSNGDNYNTACGYGTLSNTNASEYNVALGYNAGTHHNLGYNNTILGANCDGDFDGEYNIIAIGEGVTCEDNSTARIGNSATYSIGGYADWTNISDGRYKKNVKENVKGLDFILKLRPVTYNLDISGLSQKLNESRGQQTNAQMKTAMAQKEKIIQTGFVAQEVEQSAKSIGYDFSGVDKPKNENGFYGLRYAEFVVPLVKAVQEQQKIIEQQNNDIEAQKNDIETLKSQVAELTKTVNTLMNK